MVVSCEPENEEDTENDRDAWRVGDDSLLWIMAGEDE